MRNLSKTRGDMDTLIQDLRYSVRMLAKAPDFTSVVIHTVARLYCLSATVDFGRPLPDQRK
jgi:hypothetical protein